MEYCVAELTDMDQVKALLKRYHLTTIRMKTSRTVLSPHR